MLRNILLVRFAASLISASLLLHASAVTADSTGVVESRFDRFKGTTSYIYRGKGERKIASGRTPGLEFQAQAYVKAPELGAPPEASMFISHFGRGWRYLRCRNLYWLVDGAPIQLSEPKAINDVLSGGRVAEIIIQSVSIEQLEQLGSARSVEFKLCNDEVALLTEDIEALAEIARSVRSHEPR